MDLQFRNAWIYSRGTPGFTQSRNARVSTVGSEQPGPGLHSRGTRGFTQSRNAWVYTVEERLGFTRAERVDLHSLETERGTGFTQSRNAWVYTVAERVGLHSRGTRGFRQSRNAWV